MNKTKEQLREEIKHLLKVYGDALYQEWLFDEPVEMIIHKDAVFDSIFEVIEKALSQKEEEVRKEAKIQGAEDLFRMIDAKYESFKISEAVGKQLTKYRKSLTKTK